LEDVWDEVNLTSIDLDGALRECQLTSCRAVLASYLDRKLRYWHELLESRKKTLCRERSVEKLGSQIERAGGDVVRGIDRNVHVEGLSPPAYLAEVGMASEKVIVAGVAEGNIKLVECILPRSSSD
jgi:hypothetical protein